MSTPSHRLKLKRSQKHLSELTALLSAFGVRQPCPVIESVQTKRNNRRRFTYSLDLDHLEPSEMFPIILGDLLFNVRSALDHLVVAIAPVKRKSKAGFPINLRDPLRTDETSGEYVDAEAARLWLSQTKDLPDDVVTHLTILQPYYRARQRSERAEDYSLAVLSALQNADKHRNLVAVVTGLAEAHVSLDNGQTWTEGQPGAVLKNGARIHTAGKPVEVKVEGTPVVGVGRRDEVRDLLWFLDALRKDVFGQVLPRLEPFL